MNDLISRSALIEKFTAEAKKIAAKDKDFAQALMYVVTCLDIAPAVDAVEVVRCKDCKHYQYGEFFTDIKFCCRLNSKGKTMRYNFADDEFCSYGERRDDD